MCDGRWCYLKHFWLYFINFASFFWTNWAHGWFGHSFRCFAAHMPLHIHFYTFCNNSFSVAFCFSLTSFCSCLSFSFSLSLIFVKAGDPYINRHTKFWIHMLFRSEETAFLLFVYLLKNGLFHYLIFPCN